MKPSVANRFLHAGAADAGQDLNVIKGPISQLTNLFLAEVERVSYTVFGLLMLANAASRGRHREPVPIHPNWENRVIRRKAKRWSIPVSWPGLRSFASRMTIERKHSTKPYQGPDTRKPDAIVAPGRADSPGGARPIPPCSVRLVGVLSVSKQFGQSHNGPSDATGNLCSEQTKHGLGRYISPHSQWKNPTRSRALALLAASAAIGRWRASASACGVN